MNATTLTGSPARQGRMEQLQFLRFLAFFNVFVTHADTLVFFKYPSTHCAYAAVSFFFVLSGLLSGYSLYGKPISLKPRDQVSYLWRKIRKLYPLYFATVLLAVCRQSIPEMIISRDFAALSVHLRQLVKNLLLIHAWFPTGQLSFNYVSWFLSALMFLYALNLPAAWLLGKVFRHPKKYWFFSSAILGILGVTVVYCYLTQNLDMQYWHHFFPPARMGEYLSALILGYMLRSLDLPNRKIPVNTIVFTIAEAAVLLYWFISFHRPGNYWRNVIVSWLIPDFAVCIVFLLGRGWISRLFCRKPLVRLGDASFECYLLHGMILIEYLSYHPNAVNTPLDQAVGFALCLLLTVVFALLLSKNR
ncbi:MAG: acyltransferase [Oscillospiraceae bacterium]|nr:acyltransferase [Oscillospiraceae bacterium]